MKSEVEVEIDKEKGCKMLDAAKANQLETIVGLLVKKKNKIKYNNKR